MLTKEQILQTLKQHKSYFENELGVKRIGLFGSYAKGKQQPDSDVDIFIELEEPDYKKLVTTLIFLEGQFNTKVDLIYNGPHLRQSFLKTVQNEVIYA